MFQVVPCPDNCVYLQTINGKGSICGYLLETNQMRGCDPGPGCLRYVAKKEKIRGYKSRKPKWDVEKGRRMWESGCTDTQIAKELGIDRGTVTAYRRRCWGEKNV